MQVKSAVAQVPPPDGGFGWVVVFGSFLIHVVADGVTYSYGALLPVLLEVFKGGEAATAAVGSTLFGITLSVGPIAGALVNRYGCRIVTVVGAVIATAGTLISLWSPNIAFMIVSFGLVAGFGFGLIYLPAIVSVTQWFEKKRAFATGIAVCGSGAGTFIFSPLSKKLVYMYDWDGALLIIAGIIFNCCVFGALFRPVEYNTVATVTTVQDEETNSKTEVVELSVRKHKISTSSLKDKYGTGAAELRPLSASSIAKSDTHIHVPDGPRPGRISPGTEPHSFLRQTSSSERMSHGRSRSRLRLETIGVEGEVTDVKEVEVPPLAHRDALYTGSLANIAEYRDNPGKFRESMLDISKAVVINSSGDLTSIDETPQPENLSAWGKVKIAVKETLDPALLTDWVFLYFTVSNFLTSLAFQVPYIFLPDRAEKNLEIEGEDAAFLLSIIGLANIAGRLIFGFLSDRPQINRLWLYNGAVTIAGVAMCLSVWCLNYAMLATFATVFGLFIGAFVTLTSVILVDLFTLEKLTNAFGILLFWQGIASFIGPPLAGILKESSGNYDSAFIVFGIMMAVSGAMLFFIPFIRKGEKSFRSRRHKDRVGALVPTNDKANGRANAQNGTPAERSVLLETDRRKETPHEIVVPAIVINDSSTLPATAAEITA
ncbi:monocarboxylate transporter 12-like [Paramacrobiotus metropolitanus]|uniref:monocarboxylate transporter 12-like n=1 Tax=Paramacrobiotus metropolitanus TaxID=2943436 RepID=UPI00244597A7|nr:monocarboxylate transporter 12-like [Paramacrobiotus metropolitanus]XP_055334389.1 monocarboxylate transporter 12-like [Paramacrobiotus metropolitanus]